MPTRTAPQSSDSFLTFRLPSRYLELSIGHKPNNKWYLILSRNRHRSCATLPCNINPAEIVRIDSHRPNHPLQSSKQTFWFDPRAKTNWEKDGYSLLDMLLSVKPSIFELTPNKVPLRNNNTPRQIDVLIDESQLPRWCEACGQWESIEYVRIHSRWIPVAGSLDSQGLPLYLCPQCYAKDSSIKRLTRCLRRHFGLIH